MKDFHSHPIAVLENMGFRGDILAFPKIGINIFRVGSTCRWQVLLGGGGREEGSRDGPPSRFPPKIGEPPILGMPAACAPQNRILHE